MLVGLYCSREWWPAYRSTAAQLVPTEPDTKESRWTDHFIWEDRHIYDSPSGVQRQSLEIIRRRAWRNTKVRAFAGGVLLVKGGGGISIRKLVAYGRRVSSGGGGDGRQKRSRWGAGTDTSRRLLCWTAARTPTTKSNGEREQSGGSGGGSPSIQK